MSYLHARYYDPKTARFLSQDPVFLTLGHASAIQKLTGSSQESVIQQPQILNSTSYANNNPISQKDPTGLYAPIIVAIATFALTNGPQLLSVAQQNINLLALDISQGMDTFSSTTASNTDKAMAAIGIGLWATPMGDGVSGINKASRATKEIGESIISNNAGIKNLANGNKALVEKYGSIVEQGASKVAGYTNHGLMQKISREVTSSAILDTIRNPLAIIKQHHGTDLYLSNNAVVILNKSAQVVTTWGSKEFKPTIKQLIKIFSKR